MFKAVAGIAIILGGLAGLFALAVAFYAWQAAPGSLFGAIDSPEKANQIVGDYGWRSLLIAVVTIIGILSKNIYDQISSAPPGPLSIVTILASTYRNGRFWISLIVCPLVVLGFYDSIVQIQSYTLLALICYQNGFFFESVVNGISSRKAA